MNRAATLTVILLALFARGVPQQTGPPGMDASEQARMARLLATLPALERAGLEKELQKVKIDLDKVLLQQQSLGPAQDWHLQRAIESRLKPMPLVDGVPVPVLSAIGSLEQPLTANELILLKSRAASIGRIEIDDGSKELLAGTGFVVGDDTVATNCHVLAGIASLQAGTWTLKPGARLDLSEAFVHRNTMEFTITGVAAHSAVRGLDVAILEVATTSIDGTSKLPAALPTSTAALSLPPAAGVPVAVVGYPDLRNADETLFKNYRAKVSLLKNPSARMYSPGTVMEVERFEGVDHLLHVANTMRGQSGSPVFRRGNFDVIGVHNCCAPGTLPPPGVLPCADTVVKATLRNGAIGSWVARADTALRTFFLIPPL